MRILITGGTGSLGANLMKHLVRSDDVSAVICFSRDELKQSNLQSQLLDEPKARFFIGDVSNLDRLRMAAKDVDVIINTAAMKQVVACEYNPTECIRTNVRGVENIITVALEQGISKVLGISTDKAVSPCNIYGASKLVGEKLLTSANNLSGKNGPCFSSVRYGNVLGSRGSVANVYAEITRQAVSKNAKPVFPVTDKRMTRFTITMCDAVDFVLDSLNKMIGGEIFVPKLKSYNIVDFCAAFSREYDLSNIGMREGERLHEILISRDQGRFAVEFEKGYVLVPDVNFKPKKQYFDYDGEQGQPILDDFFLSSDSCEILTVDALEKILVAEGFI